MYLPLPASSSASHSASGSCGKRQAATQPDASPNKKQAALGDRGASAPASQSACAPKPKGRGRGRGRRPQGAAAEELLHVIAKMVLSLGLQVRSLQGTVYDCFFLPADNEVAKLLLSEGKRYHGAVKAHRQAQPAVPHPRSAPHSLIGPARS